MRIHKMMLIACVIFFICACSLPMPGFLKKEQDPGSKAAPLLVNKIVLLPLQSNTSDGKAKQVLWEKLSEELHFKGYAAIESGMIDQRLKQINSAGGDKKNDVIPPRVVEELLGADGAMYCSYEQENSTKLFYAPVTVSLRCVLRSAKTGETIWNAQSRSTSRSFDLFATKLRMKSRGDLEEAMEEAVAEVMETLPYGPRLRG